MTPKQQAFVREYLVDLNATQAAIRAGYSPRTANEQGSRLLAKSNIRQAVADHECNDLRRTCPGYADKRATRELGRMLAKLSATAAARQELDTELRTWLDGQPTAMLKRLIRWGLIDNRKARTSTILAQHADDYKAHLLAKGVKPKQAELVHKRLIELFNFLA